MEQYLKQVKLKERKREITSRDHGANGSMIKIGFITAVHGLTHGHMERYWDLAIPIELREQALQLEYEQAQKIELNMDHHKWLSLYQSGGSWNNSTRFHLQSVQDVQLNDDFRDRNPGVLGKVALFYDSRQAQNVAVFYKVDYIGHLFGHFMHCIVEKDSD
jgi:hypothetical protein